MENFASDLCQDIYELHPIVYIISPQFQTIIQNPAYSNNSDFSDENSDNSDFSDISCKDLVEKRRSLVIFHGKSEKSELWSEKTGEIGIIGILMVQPAG